MTCFSDLERIRTPNPQSRNLIFYPVELLGLLRKCKTISFLKQTYPQRKQSSNNKSLA